MLLLEHRTQVRTSQNNMGHFAFVHFEIGFKFDLLNNYSYNMTKACKSKWILVNMNGESPLEIGDWKYRCERVKE